MSEMNERQAVRYEVVDGIGVISIDSPPVNALAPGVREAIVRFLAEGNGDPDVTALVLMGVGRNFIAGADIRQFGKARGIGSAVSAAALESSAKPVIAAIDGYALGGGLEHALACHYRIATPRAKLGLPEVSLGIVPAGGGTQRLTRLVGPQTALEVMLSGRHVPADEAFCLGIVDEIVTDPELRDAALRFARSVAARRPLPRVSEKEDHTASSMGNPTLRASLEKQVPSRSRKLLAPRFAIDCVVAAVSLPFEQGLEIEKAAFDQLENSDESKALRYVFFAEREAAKIPGAPLGYKPERVASAAVIGAGTMGGGIAICFADVGIPVKVCEATQEALDRGMSRIRETYAIRVKRGSLSQAAMDQRLALIEPAADDTVLASCDVVIEAVFERIDLKQSVFERLEAIMKPGALLLTNSSAIDINVMADVTTRPEDVAGAHFFAPANVMKLCEIVRSERTSVQTLMRAMRMGRDLGKVAVVAGTCDGFAANRSRAPLVSEAMMLLEEGALPEQIDRVMVDFGYPMGPFAVSDLSGLDVSYDTRKRRAAADPQYRKLHVPDRMVEMGRRGQKNNLGWYRYNPGERTPIPDDEVKNIIAAVAKDLGTPQRSFTDEEILKRLLFASVNEACKILEDGKAYRGSDIDVMWIHGFAFPRHRGGLMFWADSIGAPEIYRQVTDWHTQYGRRWKPSALLAEIAHSNGRLRDATPALTTPR